MENGCGVLEPTHNFLSFQEPLDLPDDFDLDDIDLEEDDAILREIEEKHLVRFFVFI